MEEFVTLFSRSWDERDSRLPSSFVCVVNQDSDRIQRRSSPWYRISS